MATKIQIRRGTASEWSSANPVLSSGELALVTDLSKIKVGDGSTNWNSLAYISLTNTDDLTEGSSNLYFTDQRAIDAVVDSPSLTGTPTAPTADYDDDSNKIATTGYVQNAIERVTINSVSASAYELELADAGEIIEMDYASANILTVPLNSTKAFPIGTTIDIVQYGSGQTEIAGESAGVVLRSKNEQLKLTSQYSAATIYKKDTDEWVVFGDLTV
jgi:hypothetical protein